MIGRSFSKRAAANDACVDSVTFYVTKATGFQPYSRLDITTPDVDSLRVQKLKGASHAFLGAFAGIACLGLSSYAQNPGAIDVARQQTMNIQPQLQQQSLPLGVNANQLPVYTPGDLDLGIQVILKRREAEQPFRFFADTAEFYTNNVGLTKTNKQADSYFFADFGFTYERKLNDDLTFETTVRQGFFRYSEFRSLDFEDFNAGTGLSYDWKRLWDITVFARYNFERFTDGSLGSEFFQNHTISFGGQKTWGFNGGHYIYLGYSSIIGWASPTDAERDEHGFFLGGHYNFTRRFTGDIYYRVAVFDYSIGRTDLNQTVVASLAYIFNDYAKLTASASFASDRSNHSVFDYDMVTTGGGLAFQLKF